MIKMFPHVLATAACAPGGGWGGCLFAGHSDQSCLAPYYPSSLLRWLHVNSHQLADPRQDDSKIFWFLKFAPFTSNHWQYQHVSLFLFFFHSKELIRHCASIHFFHWATELLRSALRIRSSTLGCLVFFWPWILLRWGQQWTEYLAIPDIVELSIAGWLKHTEPMHLRGIWPSKSFHPRFLKSRICTGAAVVFPWSAGSIQALGSRAEAMVGWLQIWSWWDSWTGLHLKFVPAPCEGQIGLKWRQMDKNKSIKMNHSQILSDLMSPGLFSICFSNGHRSCASQNKGPSSAHLFHCCRRCAKALETKGRTRLPRKLVNSLPLHQG